MDMTVSLVIGPHYRSNAEIMPQTVDCRNAARRQLRPRDQLPIPKRAGIGLFALRLSARGPAISPTRFRRDDANAR
jgi:hypothetical protein